MKTNSSYLSNINLISMNILINTSLLLGILPDSMDTVLKLCKIFRLNPIAQVIGTIIFSKSKNQQALS